MLATAVDTPLKPVEVAATEPVLAEGTAGAASEADGRKEEEDEEADKEGKGSTGVAVAKVDVNESLTTAASSDVAEMAAIDGDGD